MKKKILIACLLLLGGGSGAYAMEFITACGKVIERDINPADYDKDVWEGILIGINVSECGVATPAIAVPQEKPDTEAPN